MIGFRVVLNGRQLVTAGLAGHHVLSAILSHVVRDPALGDVATAVAALQQLAGAARIGLAGHSYGGNITLFAAALDSRVAFACASGAAGSFRHKLSHGTGLEMALVIPGFASRFDLDDLMRCTAPRPVFVVSSESDPLAADAADLVARARPAFLALGVPDNLRHLRTGHGHALDPERFAAMVEWLTQQAIAGSN